MMCRDNSHTCCDFNIKTGRPARSLLSEETSLIGSVGLRFERRGGLLPPSSNDKCRSLADMDTLPN